MSDAPPAFRLLPLGLALALASPALADDPDPVPNPEPYIDLVHLPPEIDPGSGQRLFVCDLDSDHDPDVVLLAGGTVYLVGMVDMVASVQVLMTDAADVCLVQDGGAERLATVTSTGLWTTVFNPTLGVFESELLAQGVWQGALLVHARPSAIAPGEVDYVGVASNGQTILFATEEATVFTTLVPSFTVTTDVQEIFLLEWDGDPDAPEVAMLTEWGVQVHDVQGAPKRKVRALGASYGIERIGLPGVADGVAWLTELGPAPAQRVLYLFTQANPTYERVPPLPDPTSLPFNELVSADYDHDGDDDLLLLHDDGHSLKRFVNASGEPPPAPTFSHDPNAPFDADLTLSFDELEIDGYVTGPIAWGPLYNGYPATPPGSILDYLVLVSVEGAARLRLLSGGVPVDRIQTQSATPFSDIHVRTAAPENPTADISFTLNDIWINAGAAANAVEVVLWHQPAPGGALAPHPDPNALKRYICLLPWDGVNFPALLETQENITDPHDRWFSSAYYITAQRIEYNDSTNTIVNRWKKFVTGISMDACDDLEGTLEFLENLDGASLVTLPITTEPAMGLGCDPNNKSSTAAGSVPQVRLPPPLTPFVLPEAVELGGQN